MLNELGLLWVLLEIVNVLLYSLLSHVLSEDSGLLLSDMVVFGVFEKQIARGSSHSVLVHQLIQVLLQDLVAILGSFKGLEDHLGVLFEVLFMGVIELSVLEFEDLLLKDILICFVGGEIQ